MAEFLEKQTRRYRGKLKITLGSSRQSQAIEDALPEDPDAVTFEDKWELTERIRKVPQSTVERIVSLVKEEAPTAYENEESDQVKIKLDLIKRPVFMKIQEIMTEEIEANGVPYKKHKKN